MAGKRAAPPICQLRPLFQNWASGNLLTSVLIKINRQAASLGERAWRLECWGVKGSRTSDGLLSLPTTLIFPAYGPQFPHVSNEQGGAAYL